MSSEAGGARGRRLEAMQELLEGEGLKEVSGVEATLGSSFLPVGGLEVSDGLLEFLAVSQFDGLEGVDGFISQCQEDQS